MNLEQAYERLTTALREQAHIQEALKLLEWDQATYMPPGANEHRAAQMGTLAQLLHGLRTEPRFLALVDALAEHLAELPPQWAVDVRETKWRSDRLRRVPAALLAARARSQAIARTVWAEARDQNRFDVFAPHLSTVVALEREYALALDPSGNPYQALLEEYEPGLDAEYLQSLFLELRPQLTRMVAAVRSLRYRRPPHPKLSGGSFPSATQKALHRFVAERIGFDFRTGRLDESVHPFSISLGMDHRLTTRFDERDLRVGLYSTLHELGHALYDQGLDPAALGLPRGTPCSLGIHESQSRLWENLVGRSVAFWRFLLPHGRRFFPELAEASLDAVVLEVNEAAPTPIRTEADEITYNLHIILRYDLERALIEQRLRPADLPEAWRRGMLELLGIAPGDDREGALQDIHWASGAFGYFPTYTLGNMYAAQFMAAAERELGPLSPHIERGDFTPFLRWLRTRIHCLGQTYRSVELVEHVTGAPPSTASLREHLHRRLEWLQSIHLVSPV